MEKLPVAVGGIKLCRTCSDRTRNLCGGPAYIRSTWPISAREVLAARIQGQRISELSNRFGVSERHILRLLAKAKRAHKFGASE